MLEGRVLVMNDRSEAEAKKLRGALGAKPNSTDAIAYVFGEGPEVKYEEGLIAAYRKVVGNG